jgi:ATP-dependent helicase HrpB
VTELGRATLDLGIHPRLARILAIGSRAGMANEAATVAAILSEPDFLVLDEVRAVVDSLPAARSDLIFRIDRLSVAENERFAPRLRELGINPHAARSVARTRDVLRRVIERSTAGAIDPALVDAVGGLDPESALLALIFLGYPDRLARRRPNQPEVGLMVGGRGVRLDRVSLLRDDPLFVVVEGREVKRGVSEVLVTIASGVEREWLGVLAPGAVNEVDTVELDRATGRVHGFRAAHYFDLPIEEPRRSPPSEADAQRVIMEYLRSHMEEWIAGDEAMREWIGRWRFLARAVPELELPEPEIELLIEIHADIARTARGLDDLRRVPFSELARSVLSPVQYSAIEREAPAGLTLPNGRTARIHYGLDTAPRLEVRVQDLFGWRETPRIARGRVLLLLEILGPNFRPVQRTNDLAGFWAGTYQQVRKDLRARYPKHAWPENPRDAAPIVRNKPKR